MIDEVLGNYRHRLAVSIDSQSVAGNSSDLDYEWRVTRQVPADRGDVGVDVTFRLVFDGEVIEEPVSFDFTANVDEIVISGSKTLTHQPNGSREVSATITGPFDLPSQSFPQITASGRMTLPHIDRASSPSLLLFGETEYPTYEPYSPVEVVTDRASADLTHDITYQARSLSGTIGTDIGASVPWSVDPEIFAQFPNSPSGTFTIRTVTKDGGVVVGERSKTYGIAGGSQGGPFFDTILHEDVEPASLAIGAYVEGVSRLKLTMIGASGVNGASVVGYKMTVGDQVLRAPTGTLPLPTFRSGLVEIRGELTDSRGRTGSTYNDWPVANFLPYVPPSILSAPISRTDVLGVPDKDGTRLHVHLSAEVQSLVVSSAEQNDLTWTIKTRTRGTSTPWDSIAPVGSAAIGGVVIDEPIMIPGYSPSLGYDVRVEVADELGKSAAVEGVLPAGGIQLHLPSDVDAIGVGKFHEQGSVDALERMHQRDGLQVIDEGDAATESLAGIVQLATDLETISGTNNTKAVTPFGFMYALGLALPLDTGWIPLAGSYANGFSGHTVYPPQYRKIGEVVYLRGEFWRSTAPGASATITAKSGGLPPGFRPGAGIAYTTIGFWGLVVEISSTGDIMIAANLARPSGVGYRISGAPFPAEQ